MTKTSTDTWPAPLRLDDPVLAADARHLHVQGAAAALKLAPADEAGLVEFELRELHVTTLENGQPALYRERRRGRGGHKALAPHEVDKLLHSSGLRAPTLCAAACGLAAAHARLAQVPVSDVRATVAVARGTPCPKWHVDSLALRGLCFLHGPGSVVWDARANAEVRTAVGDVLFLRGGGADGSMERLGALHQSPHVDESVLRVVVKTDSA